MTATLPQPDQPRTPRQRDRRQAFGDLLLALTRTLDTRVDISLMRGAFEEGLRRVVPVRSIQLREAASRWIGRLEGALGSESIAFDVPGPDTASQAVLEATFDPGCRLGEWDFQMLGWAAQLGALVLEIERGRRSTRGAGPSVPKAKRDGAAVLIGSTPAMQSLRSRVERVAGTDFTVLLEGASDR